MRSFSSIVLLGLSLLLLVSSAVGQCEPCGDELEVGSPDAVVFSSVEGGLCDSADGEEVPEFVCLGLNRIFGPISSVTCADLDAVDSDLLDDICPAVRVFTFKECDCTTDEGISLPTLFGLIIDFFKTILGL